LTRWPGVGITLLYGIRILSYSPAYLSILRIMRMTRVNIMIKMLQKQNKYNLFKKGDQLRLNNSMSSNVTYVLKWTTTSDQSTLFLDIVKVVEDTKSKMNWHLKFPQSFIICKFNFQPFLSRKWNLQSTIQTRAPRSTSDQNG